MTDKPMKNGRKYMDSGFVHNIMDTENADHYFVRAHVWPSMRTELPHNVRPPVNLAGLRLWDVAVTL